MLLIKLSKITRPVMMTIQIQLQTTKKKLHRDSSTNSNNQSQNKTLKPKKLSKKEVDHRRHLSIKQKNIIQTTNFSINKATNKKT